MQLLGNVNARNLFPTAIRARPDQNMVDFHLGAPHSPNAQKCGPRLARQNKLTSECCIETGKPMRVRVDRSGKDDPLRPTVARQKIDCRIMPRDPRQDRYRHADKCDHKNRSVPRFEN
jgi:hypothetical protein